MSTHDTSKIRDVAAYYVTCRRTADHHIVDEWRDPHGLPMDQATATRLADGILALLPALRKPDADWYLTAEPEPEPEPYLSEAINDRCPRCGPACACQVKAGIGGAA